MFYVSPVGSRHTIGTPFSYGGVSYGKFGATHDTFISLGFTKVIPEARPSDKYYIVGTVKADGTYDATPRPLEQLKENEILAAKRTCGQLLSVTDWMVIRFYELGAGYEVPAEQATYRADIRAASNARQAAINACVDVAELEALVTAPVLIAEDPETVGSNMIPNPAALPQWPVNPADLP